MYGIGLTSGGGGDGGMGKKGIDKGGGMMV